MASNPNLLTRIARSIGDTYTNLSQGRNYYGQPMFPPGTRASAVNIPGGPIGEVGALGVLPRAGLAEAGEIPAARTVGLAAPTPEPEAPAFNIADEHRDFIGRGGNGENKWEMVARKPNKQPVGVIEYTTTTDEPGRPKIDNVVVHPDFRRQGIATSMFGKLAEKYGGYQNIDHALTTPEGTALKEAMDRKFSSK